MTPIRRLAALAASALLAPALIAGCGGGDEQSEVDPQQVVEETFSGDKQISSGVLEVTAMVSAEGEEGGNFELAVEGPFQSASEDAASLPQLDLTASLSGEAEGQSIDFEGGLVVTDDNAFVEYQDTAYEVGSANFAQLEQAFEAEAGAQTEGSEEDLSGLIDQLGIDPESWVTNLANEGTEDVEGAETVHISADADVAAMLEDISTAAEQSGAGATAPIDPADLEQVDEFVEEASIDLYSGTEDRILRRLDATLTIIPSEDAGVEEATVELSIVLSEVNEEQTISAPENPRPIVELADELGALGMLGGLPGGPGLEGLPGGPDAGDGTGGGGGEGPGAEAADAYLDCVAEASSPEEINACAQEFQP